jgi:predicted nucleotide-binding protein (sugar kinase/HSP70/actin superfamily)
MAYAGARLFAAVLRSVGVESRVSPESNEQTLELGGLHTSGEECYPEKITLGDFLRVLKENGPDKTAFFLPTAEGPCRFGQYAPYLRQVLDEMGHTDVPIISPTSKDGYDGIGQTRANPIEMIRSFWRALVCGDILVKILLQTRPYEITPGDTDSAFEKSLGLVEQIMENTELSNRARLKELGSALGKARELFHAVPVCYVRDKPLIGVVGEIFCRMNTFSNYDAIRKIEAHGGECWLSDTSEWVWYTNWSQQAILRRDGKRFSLSMLGAKIKNKVQRADENALFEPFKDDFTGYEEPHDLHHEVLKPAWEYLPADGALGEMVLSVGKSIYLYNKGADGIVDISPFSCMNGIITEAVYHDVVRDYDQMPIRNFYFDASSSNMERDLDIFMELADSYRRRKKTKREYPACFED